MPSQGTELRSDGTPHFCPCTPSPGKRNAAKSVMFLCRESHLEQGRSRPIEIRPRHAWIVQRLRRLRTGWSGSFLRSRFARPRPRPADCSRLPSIRGRCDRRVLSRGSESRQDRAERIVVLMVRSMDHEMAAGHLHKKQIAGGTSSLLAQDQDRPPLRTKFGQQPGPASAPWLRASTYPAVLAALPQKERFNRNERGRSTEAA